MSREKNPLVRKHKQRALDVLLVEDNSAHAELIIRWLEAHEVAGRVFHVNDGEAALDYIFNRGQYSDTESFPRPRLVLLDLRLPKIDGLEVLTRIKATPEIENVPVIILTTSAAQRDLEKAYQNHVNSYLVKPMDHDKFKSLLNEIGYYWLKLNCDTRQ